MSRTIYCSFCGKSNHDAGRMMESSDKHVPGELVRICLACARDAVEMLEPYENQHNQQ
jgi:hypothetical protein